jgi:Skp family chaperone for outer membrane proteins
MKRLLIGMVALAALALPQVAHAKTGVVSFEDVLAKTKTGKAITKKITAYFKRKQALINRKKKALQADEKALMKAFKQLQASETILKPSVFKARKNKLEQRYRQLVMKGQRLMAKVNGWNQQLQERRYKLLQPLRQVFLTTVTSLAKAKGLSIVIERTAVYYHKAAIDITNAVIARINAVTK